MVRPGRTAQVWPIRFSQDAGHDDSDLPRLRRYAGAGRPPFGCARHDAGMSAVSTVLPARLLAVLRRLAGGPAGLEPRREILRPEELSPHLAADIGLGAGVASRPRLVPHPDRPAGAIEG